MATETTCCGHRGRCPWWSARRCCPWCWQWHPPWGHPPWWHRALGFLLVVGGLWAHVGAAKHGCPQSHWVLGPRPGSVGMALGGSGGGGVGAPAAHLQPPDITQHAALPPPSLSSFCLSVPLSFPHTLQPFPSTLPLVSFFSPSFPPYTPFLLLSSLMSIFPSPLFISYFFLSILLSFLLCFCLSVHSSTPFLHPSIFLSSFCPPFPPFIPLLPFILLCLFFHPSIHSSLTLLLSCSILSILPFSLSSLSTFASTFPSVLLPSLCPSSHPSVHPSISSFALYVILSSLVLHPFPNSFCLSFCSSYPYLSLLPLCFLPSFSYLLLSLSSVSLSFLSVPSFFLYVLPPLPSSFYPLLFLHPFSTSIHPSFLPPVPLSFHTCVPICLSILPSCPLSFPISFFPSLPPFVLFLLLPFLAALPIHHFVHPASFRPSLPPLIPLLHPSVHPSFVCPPIPPSFP